MLLAIDVGNTQTVFGVYREGLLRHRWHVAPNKKPTPDELRMKLPSLLG
ncbi:type III pantothenate kinase, partial [Rubneribacter sp.]